MPLLYYGNFGSSSKRKLYNSKLNYFETSIFNKFKIDHLAPYPHRPYIANYWWFNQLKHCALAWEELDRVEQVIFLPGWLQWREALIIARDEFKDIVPSAIVFRINNQDGPYLYD